jgi:AcrR family transcriptional regulator
VPRPSRWDDLLEAATDEFAERGFDRATIGGIADRVGIFKASVYHYVKSKEELLFAVVEQPAKELLEYMSALVASEATASEKLRSFFRRQVGIFSEHYPAAFVYLGLIGRESQPEAFRERDAEYIALLVAILDEGVDNGEFELAVAPKTAALALAGALGWMQHWFVPRSPAETDELADALYALAVGGLTGGKEALAGLPQLDATGDDPVGHHRDDASALPGRRS